MWWAISRETRATPAHEEAALKKGEQRGSSSDKAIARRRPDNLRLRALERRPDDRPRRCWASWCPPAEEPVCRWHRARAARPRGGVGPRSPPTASHRSPHRGAVIPMWSFLPTELISSRTGCHCAPAHRSKHQSLCLTVSHRASHSGLK